MASVKVPTGFGKVVFTGFCEGFLLVYLRFFSMASVEVIIGFHKVAFNGFSKGSY